MGALNLDLFDRIVFHNPVSVWLAAAGVAAVLFAVMSGFKFVIVRRLSVLAAKTPTKLDDLLVAVVQATRLPFLLLAAVFAGSHLLDLPDGLRASAPTVMLVVFLLQVGFWGDRIFGFVLPRVVETRIPEAGASGAIAPIGFLGRVLLWTAILLLALDNLGVDITALIAGLGVGGIAVALALQTVLGDLFASLSITLDKPFAPGDFIIIGDLMGVVEKIGIKTTRVRSLSGEQLVFANNDLLQSRIRNFKRMFERRVLFTVGVTYPTPRTKLEAVPAILREAVLAQSQVRFDRAHLKAFGAYSIDFEAVYYVLSPDYNLHMDIQQAILLHLHRRFGEEGVEFAYPTQTVILAKS